MKMGMLLFVYCLSHTNMVKIGFMIKTTPLRNWYVIMWFSWKSMHGVWGEFRMIPEKVVIVVEEKIWRSPDSLIWRPRLVAAAELTENRLISSHLLRAWSKNLNWEPELRGPINTFTDVSLTQAWHKPEKLPQFSKYSQNSVSPAANVCSYTWIVQFSEVPRGICVSD